MTGLKIKNKSIAFVSNTWENEDQCEKGIEESISDAISLLGIKFNKSLKRLDKISRTNVKGKGSDNFKNIDFQYKRKDEDKPNKGKGIQCHECEGLDHIKVECPTFLKKQKKGNVN